ncbi:hypothetical protein JCM10207_003240 [Rhodosporidiobolus poonsookiae]
MAPRAAQGAPADGPHSASAAVASPSDSGQPSPVDPAAAQHHLPHNYYAQMMQGYPGYPPFALPPGYPPFSFSPASHPTSTTPSASDAGPSKKRGRTSTPSGIGRGKKGDGASDAGKGKKVEVAVAVESDDDGDDDEVKRKKRLPLSCGECQRRKIKCDRKMPCSACVRRKRTAFCSFDDEDPSSPYALNSDVRTIDRRLTQLESLFRQQFPSTSLSTGLPHPHPADHSSHTAHPSPASFSASSHPSPHHLSSAGPSHPSPAAMIFPSNGSAGLPPVTTAAAEEIKQSGSDTEDAVADLEEKTFGARVPVLQALHAAAESNARRYNYPKVADMELNATLTSILAEPLSFDQDGRPRSAVRLGLDLAVSTGDLPAVRHDALAQIYAVLPDPEISQYLIKKYFSEMEWEFRVLDPEAFPAEFQRFVQMKAEGREDLIDPLWLAVFCMVLALSLEGFWSRPNGMKDLSLFHGLAEQDLKDLPSVWHDASLRALQLGEWGGTPRIRTIQCILLMTSYIQLASSSGQNGRILGWVSSAICVAQRMGLHRLGANPQTMPPDDPALPPGSNSVKRETAVRLWNMLVNVDSWLSDSPTLRCYLLHPSQYNTARPLNLNFGDLSRTDWRTPLPPPLTVCTDASFELVQCKIAEQIRRALDTLVLSEHGFSYPAVLDQDRAFRQILEDVPECFAERTVAIDSPRITFQRACLHEDVFSRIVRLNRPLLGRGYSSGSPFAYSTEQCIEAAKALIVSNLSMLQIETSRWWMYTGTLASSIVLMMDIFHGIDHDAPEEAIKEKRDILLKARTIFDTQVATPALTAVVEEGRKILAALFIEEERRRTTRAAHTMASAPPPSLETFAQVLKRVSREVATQTQPNPLTLVPTAGLARTPLPPPSLPTMYPPFSFAQAAATAMANTPTTFHAPTPTSSTPFDPSGTSGFGAAPDFSSFFSLVDSQDWTAGVSVSPSGGDALLDSLYM